jgi:hypothetical protein
MIWFIIGYILLFILKYPKENPTTLPHSTRIYAWLVGPLLQLGFVLLWNWGGHNVIGWPEVKSFQEFVVLFIFF